MCQHVKPFFIETQVCFKATSFHSYFLGRFIHAAKKVDVKQLWVVRTFWAVLPLKSLFIRTFWAVLRNQSLISSHFIRTFWAVSSFFIRTFWAV